MSKYKKRNKKDASFTISENSDEDLPTQKVSIMERMSNSDQSRSEKQHQVQSNASSSVLGGYEQHGKNSNIKYTGDNQSESQYESSQVTETVRFQSIAQKEGMSNGIGSFVNRDTVKSESISEYRFTYGVGKDSEILKSNIGGNIGQSNNSINQKEWLSNLRLTLDKKDLTPVEIKSIVVMPDKKLIERVEAQKKVKQNKELQKKQIEHFETADTARTNIDSGRKLMPDNRKRNLSVIPDRAEVYERDSISNAQSQMSVDDEQRRGSHKNKVESKPSSKRNTVNRDEFADDEFNEFQLTDRQKESKRIVQDLKLEEALKEQRIFNQQIVTTQLKQNQKNKIIHAVLLFCVLFLFIFSISTHAKNQSDISTANEKILKLEQDIEDIKTWQINQNKSNK